MIEVRDQGAGISDEILQRLFEPFQSTKRQGLGMGLSISKSIIELHGGRLWAENNPDCGATFYLCLPADRVEITKNIKGREHVESVADGLRGR